MNARDVKPIKLDVWIPVGFDDLVREITIESGLEIEIRGFTMLESAEPPIHLLFQLDPLVRLLESYVAYKVLDGALGELGAQGTRLLEEALRRIARASRKFAESAEKRARKAIASVQVSIDETSRRWYPLPLDDDLDEATLAILDDLGVPITRPGDTDRVWVSGRWVGVRVDMEARENLAKREKKKADVD